jgi:hypothetical protein
MRALRGSLLLLAAAGSVMLAGTGPAGAQTSHPGGVPDTCPEVLAGTPTNDLEMRTTPSAGDVRGGEIITVTLRWSPESFDRLAVHKVLDCVTVNGGLVPELSKQERDAPNNGAFDWHFTVPAQTPVGTRICDRGFVSGPGPGNGFEREKSNDTCLTVAPPAASDNGAPSQAAPPSAEGRGPVPNAASPSGPASNAASPGPTPTEAGSPPSADSTTPPSAPTPDTISITPAPSPAATPGVHPSPTVDSYPSAALTPDVQAATALPATGASPTPLVLAGMVLCVGGACRMTGVRRQRR